MREPNSPRRFSVVIYVFIPFRELGNITIKTKSRGW